MIRSFFGLTQTPFDRRDLDLLPGQQEILDTLKVHCQQGGLCLVLGLPGTGKSVLKQAVQKLPESQYLVATVARTLHTYTNTVKILCDAFRVAFDHSAFPCERRLIEQAFALNHAGKALTTILANLPSSKPIGYTIEDGVIFAGQVGLGDHVHIGPGVVLGGQGGVFPGKHLTGPGQVFAGTPAEPLFDYLKSLARIRRLK